jgi:hypothetical protein
VKISTFLREYQLTGKVPDGKEAATLAFWAGWMMGHSLQIDLATPEQKLETAIKAAEFIEEHAKG